MLSLSLICFLPLAINKSKTMYIVIGSLIDLLQSIILLYIMFYSTSNKFIK